MARKKTSSAVLSASEIRELLAILGARFESNQRRHPGFTWPKVKARLEAQPHKMRTIWEMEQTGGEPDLVGEDAASGELIYMDCAAESPAGRRSICYDGDALASRKTAKPWHSAEEMAAEMSVELLTEKQYHELQLLGPFDLKTSSWLKTPAEIRKLGGAIFGDCRFGRVFIYHNGAESYYAARGFRALCRV